MCQLAEIQCPFGCGSKFPRGHFYTHQSECEKKPSRCPQCDIIYPNDLIEVWYAGMLTHRVHISVERYLF